MATYTFGTDVDPSHFVEIPDGADPGQVKRPAAGTVTLKVRNEATLGDLPDTVVDTYGYWSYTTTDVPIIRVSADGGASWVGPLLSAEVKVQQATAGTNAILALQNTNALDLRLDSVEATLQNGGGGVTGGGTIATSPPGSVFYVFQNADLTWPLRPTSRTDVVIRWRGQSAPPSGNGYAIAGIDEVGDTSP